MTCSIGSDELSQYVLGDVEAADEQRIREHLEGGCESCAAELNRLSSLSDLLHQAASNQPERADAWECINTRLPSETSASSASIRLPDQLPPSDSDWKPGHRRRPRSWSVGIGIAAATACSFLLATFALQSSRRQDPVANSTDSRNANGLSVQEFAKSEDNSTRRVSMRRKGNPSKRYGSFLVDRLSRQLHLYTADWQPLTNNQRFVIWFVTANETIIEGDHLKSSNVDAQLHLIDLPETKSPVVSIAVTIEQDDDWSTHQKQPAMAAGSKLESAWFVSDDFGDLLDRNI